MLLNSFVFCSSTQECSPEVTANMMAAIEVADLSSNAKGKKEEKQGFNYSHRHQIWTKEKLVESLSVL